MKWALLIILIFSGCETIENSYDEKTRCTTKSNGDVECKTKYYDKGVITCQVYEDGSEACIAEDMTIDEVVMVYDSPDAVIDVSDEEVIVEYPDNMIGIRFN